MSTSTLETGPEASSAQSLAGKYLTFKLGEESYGIAVLKIREIIRLTAITAVPQMPGYVKGVINLRGKIIPVMDLRAKFGMAEVKPTEHTCIVVVQVELAGQPTAHMGLIVDEVEEVAQLTARDIEETPDFGSSQDTAWVLGMAKIKGVVKSLLDIDRILAAQTAETFTLAATRGDTKA